MLFNSQLWRQARTHSLALLFTLISGLSAAVFAVLQAYFIARLINAAFLGETLPDGIWGMIWPIGLAIGLRALFQYMTDVLSAEVGLRTKEELRARLLNKVLSDGSMMRAGDRSGETISTLTDGLETLDPFFSQYIPQLLLAAVVPVVILASISFRDWLSFAVLLITAPLLPVFMSLVGSLSQKSTIAQWQKLHKLGSFFFETIQGIHLLLSFNISAARGKEIQEKDDTYRQLTLQVLRMTFLSAFVLELISTIGTALIAVEIGLRLLRGGIDFHTALFVLLLAPEFYLPLRQLGARFHAGMSGRAAAVQVFKLLGDSDTAGDEKLVGAEKSGQGNSQLSDNSAVHETGYKKYFPVRLRSVTVSYPGTERDVLTDVDLTLAQGEHLALIGPSGEGKTTLTMLLLGMLKPTRGEITFGGRPASVIPDAELAGLFSWVPQAPYIFAGTIAENICMFAPEADPERIQTAGRSAMLAGWVESLPDGYQTRVGERGVTISAGQAQRLAIARAFYRDAPILILDEPTSALDVILEDELIQLLDLLSRGRTVVNIAHRLSTIRDSQQIVRIEDGKVHPLSQAQVEQLLRGQTEPSQAGRS
jgi:ATP-binding cassette subfamily C protein CydD